MTHEEALLVLRKYLNCVQIFASEIQPDPDNLVARWMTAMKQPELANALAEYEEARASLVNENAAQLSADVAIILAALDELNS